MFLSLPVTYHVSGEQGKVDEAQREMAAIEALRSEKSGKEVRVVSLRRRHTS